MVRAHRLWTHLWILVDFIFFVCSQLRYCVLYVLWTHSHFTGIIINITRHRHSHWEWETAVFISFHFISLHFTLFLYICAVQNIITPHTHTDVCYVWYSLLYMFLVCVFRLYIFIKCSNGNINAVTTAIAAMMTPTMNIPYHTKPYQAIIPMPSIA